MSFQFWNNRAAWPLDPKGLTFLGRAVCELGRVRHRDDWSDLAPGIEPPAMPWLDEAANTDLSAPAALETLLDQARERMPPPLSERDTYQRRQAQAVFRELRDLAVEGRLRTFAISSRTGARRELDSGFWAVTQPEVVFSECRIDDDDSDAERIFVDDMQLQRHLRTDMVQAMHDAIRDGEEAAAIERDRVAAEIENAQVDEAARNAALGTWPASLAGSDGDPTQAHAGSGESGDDVQSHATGRSNAPIVPSVGAPRGGRYEDIPLFLEMAGLIDGGMKILPAAKAVVAKSEGGGNEDSRIDRLRRGYSRWAKQQGPKR
ncbi:hypothetical protein FHS55_001577 [Angulomicrobium tetraedrale]|uniref:Uncharacterized protein n=1 Tax=Ancylobacter tetraedralis TaxID=217068 RepID=A0A839Z5N8_9HYPH|nr:hypothetical protein [Ancylobacter tetraedralis]MBB3770982.1 hypothetical protein [Ancylobacter tetraedralis]